jgi:hypothetical protein
MKALAVNVVLGLALGVAVACGGGVASPDLSTSPDAGDGTATADGSVAADAARGPYDTALTCTSGKTWTRNNAGSALMTPGRACGPCHAMLDGPRYMIAGTVYPTAHEPDDCNGVGATPQNGLRVVVTDANEKTISITPNSAGNFFSLPRLASPFHAKVVSGSKTRECPLALTSGDCNACHTEQGANGAPGRIVAP